MYRIGYIYKQKYSFVPQGSKDPEKDRKEGYTLHAIIHTISASGEVLRTHDYKCCKEVEALGLGDYDGAPVFDGYGRFGGFLGGTV